uniref:Putative disease resistance RPP13-like protein 1 n=1 Tax=Aegilops tauschii TaxID=37682 RepID=M8CEC1_AEGTA
MVGWVASATISKLLAKGFDYLEYDTAKKLAQLEPKILVLERVMEVVETSPYRPRLEQLFKRLKYAFYEAEEILDAVEYHCLEKQIKTGKLQPGGGSSLPKKDRLKKKESRMSNKKLVKSLKKIENIINEAHQILEKLNLSSISDGNIRHTMVVNPTTTAVSPQKVFGRDNDRDKIIAMLHEKEGGLDPSTSKGLCFSVIGIHGVSGSGKSTLAQFVYAHEKNDKQDNKEDHFDLVMWVHVSQDFSVWGIFKELYEAASDPKVPCPQFNNLNALEEELERKLDGKRFLLVLDDVWCNADVGNQELPKLLSPLKKGKKGSKILVTTRSKYALPDLCPGVRYTAMPITEVDDTAFFELFMHYALEDGQDQSMFQNIGVEIAKKLKGSPLAARTVGGNLRRQQDVDHWRRVGDQDLFKVWTGPLWWSYYQLGEQARRCFAYCSIFPRRHRLYRDELVRLWMAEGFIRNTDEGADAEDVGLGIFNELLSISFLQPGGQDWYNHGKEYYLVHDLLYDLAGAVAGTDCFRIDNNMIQKKMFPETGPGLQFSNIGRLVSLQTIPAFKVSHEQGHEAKQLRYLNRLSGELSIYGLQSVESREEALAFDLAAKKRLAELTLSFGGSSEVAAEVLEGLCPPVGLVTLDIRDYDGLVYPKWMVGRQNGAPEKLQQLGLSGWSQPGPAPALKAFNHLRCLNLMHCSWNALPCNMEHLSSLETVIIIKCLNIRSLPTLPQSLTYFWLLKCDDGFMESCQTVGHPNWKKIQHICRKYFR